MACALVGSSAHGAQIGTVQAQRKISRTEGGFVGSGAPSYAFGLSVAALGDLDDDGVQDLAVGTGSETVWILFMSADGTVASEASIGATTGGFGGMLAPGDSFGWSVCPLGDLDGDGNEDLAVGAPGDDAGGAVWILFLDQSGTVLSETKIGLASGGFDGHIDPSDFFGCSLAALDDSNADGTRDLAVGARGDAGGSGAVWVLFLQPDGSVTSEHKIGSNSGGFTGALDSGDHFGGSVARIGDVDGDGDQDLAVGAHRDDDGGTDLGAVWILLLNADATVAAQSKISATTGGFTGALDADDCFGWAVAPLGDLNGDRRPDLAVGVYRDDDGGPNQGAVWLLFLGQDATVALERKVSETSGGFGGALDPHDSFGVSTALIDSDGDGTVEIAVGAEGDDDGGSSQGAVWLVTLEGDGTPPEIDCPSSVLVTDSKSGPFGALVSFSVLAVDDEDPTPSVACVPPSGSFFPRGTTLVTCTATDAAGNRSVCQFPVTVMPTVRERRL